MIARGCTPRNDQRPTRCPPSADSSRKLGPDPRSFRYAETGVSVSAMKVWRSGTTVWSRASSRASSRPGRMSRPMSAATGIELLEGVGQRQAARRQQHRQVVEHVGGLRGHALVGLLARRAGYLLGLLLHLRADPRRVRQQLGGVAVRRGRRPPRRDRPLEHGQRLVNGGAAVAVVETRALAGVAGGTGRLHERQDRVKVAVEAQLADLLDVAGGLPLVPQLLARAAPEPR